MAGSGLLVLWDVDHTLLETRGVGSVVFREAFEAATGVGLEVMPDPTGLTEPAIFDAACRMAGVTVSLEVRSVFYDEQVQAYLRHAAELRERGRVLPGVREVLESLAGRGGVLQSVLSGNTRAASRAKLGVFGLDGYVDWDVAAGGDDHQVRPSLVPFVWDRVREKYGTYVGPVYTVLVGDTPADVKTGNANGCRVVGVATGRTDVDGLRRAGADPVLTDLSDTAAVLEALLT